jgi:hypothetical protein
MLHLAATNAAAGRHGNQVNWTYPLRRPGMVAMTGSDILTLAPWVVFGACVTFLYFRLRRSRRQPRRNAGRPVSIPRPRTSQESAPPADRVGPPPEQADGADRDDARHPWVRHG